jgi:hypothetical protein
MSTDDIRQQESTEQNWEAVARNVLAPRLRDLDATISDELHNLADQVESGEVEVTTLKRSRTQLDMAIELIEENLGPTEGSYILTEFESDKIERGEFVGLESDS